MFKATHPLFGLRPVFGGGLVVRAIGLMTALLGMVSVAAQTDTTGTPQAPRVIPASLAASNVAIISIDRGIDSVMSRSFDRRLTRAEEQGADLVVVELDTPGGEVGAVLEICNRIKDSSIPRIVAWVNVDAYSGGAIIALACWKIVVAPTATLGDALPIRVSFGMLNTLPDSERHKILQPLLSEVESSARQRGWDQMLVQGIVSRHVELWRVRNKDTGEEYFVGPEEYTLATGQEPVRRRPTLPSARSGGDPAAPSGGAAPPAALPAVEQLPAPLDDAELDTPSPRGPDEQVAPFIAGDPDLPDEVVEAVSAVQEYQSNRPDFARAPHRGAYVDVEYVSDGEGLVVLKADHMLAYRIAMPAPGAATPHVSDETELAAMFGTPNVVRLDETWSERGARVLINPIVRGLLIVVMLVCFFIELSGSGFGAFGAAAAGALFLLIAPPLVADMASWWEIVAILVGIALLGLEFFVIPGFGVAGGAGMLLMFLGLLGTFVGDSGGLFPDSPQERSRLLYGVFTIVLSVGVASVTMFFLSKQLQSAPLLGRLVLKDEPRSGEGLLGAMGRGDARDALVGARGVAVSPLRPGGRVEIDGEAHEAEAEVGFIESGASVWVVGLRPFHLVVSEDAPSGGDEAAGEA